MTRERPIEPLKGFSLSIESEATRQAGLPTIEWPTLLLAIGVYAAWCFLTASWRTTSPFILVPALVIVVALHSSLQHEVLHGHPTASRAVNTLLAVLPLSLWLPYARYRRLHLQHHVNDRLTDPLDDPESFYWTPEVWETLSPLTRFVVRLDMTLLGRILVGGVWHIALFLRDEWRAILANVPGIRRTWVWHLVLCVPIIVWLHTVAAMPLWIYVVGVVLPARSLLLVRSFAEHRARADVPRRTAIVEGAWFFGPLFLFNNLHALHHDEPLLPWYAYPSRYRVRRDDLIEANGGLVYRTYWDVLRRYALTAHDVTVHPFGRAPRARA
jgi:fatty acid desaturase